MRIFSTSQFLSKFYVEHLTTKKRAPEYARLIPRLIIFLTLLLFLLF